MLLKQHKNINIYKKKGERKKFKAYLFKSWNDTTHQNSKSWSSLLKGIKIIENEQRKQIMTIHLLTDNACENFGKTFYNAGIQS